MLKIAIFGGAFNPVHREHVNLARAAVEALDLDKIIIMPTAVSPHKVGRMTAGFWQRFEMCRFAFADVPQAEVNAYELSQGGVSYSYLTCEHFAKLYADADRYFIIGADMLRDFIGWKNPESILKGFRLAACARENSEEFNGYKRAVEEKFSTRVITIPYVGERVSSTKVRTLAALGEDTAEYVNAEVGQYIKDNALYRIEEACAVKDMLKPERWQHTLRVAYMCAQNCRRAGVEERTALTMAALHDCAKYLTPESPLLKGFDFPAGVPQPVMHQYTGAYVAERFFKISDKTVLSAIGCHATGKPYMSEADMLLYLCDMLEEGRSFEGVDKLRAEFEKSIKGGMAAALEHQIKYLASTGAPVDGNTKKTYDWLKENL